jgi:uncharacterized Zn finger protein (UPF0148 family)
METPETCPQCEEPLIMKGPGWGFCDNCVCEIEETVMTHEEFSKHIETFHAMSRNVLEDKAKEYAKPDDRLSQFYEVARMPAPMECNPMEALIGMATKHFTSMANMARLCDWSVGKWNEKCIDLANYCFLALALIRDPRLTAYTGSPNINQMMEDAGDGD